MTDRLLAWWRLYVAALARRGLPERVQTQLLDRQDVTLLGWLDAMSDEQLAALSSLDDETPPA